MQPDPSNQHGWAIVNSELGSLESVGLTEIWPNEANDFTPWLEDENNLARLSEALGLELEIIGTEQGVGRFRADIVCRNLSDDSRSVVLIENQIAPTDHSHLGQTLTYAAGLEAVTVVWIASKFKDEHRAAVDWLNERTDEGLAFFALEIELWKIGDSVPAPKFNIVSRPNDWTAEISRTTKQPPSQMQEQHKRFWTSLAEHLNDSDRLPKPRKPSIDSYTTFRIGVSGFELRSSRSHQKGQLQVSLVMRTENSLSFFKQLETSRDDVEAAIGGDFEWTERPAGRECVISCNTTEFDPTEEEDWPAQINWATDKIHSFFDHFKPVIEKLDPSDWSPEIEDDSG